MSASSLLDRVRRRHPAPGPPSPPEPIDSEAALRLLALADTADAAHAAHVAAVGRVEAAVGALRNAESVRESAGRAERDGLTTRDASGGWGWRAAPRAVEDAGREVERASGELLEAESLVGPARAALDESLAALVGAMGDAGHAARFLELQGELAARDVASAEAAFTPAVNRMMEARRARRHPRDPAELAAVLADGPHPAEAERAVEEADAVQQAARRRAREVVAMRERFERACAAALAHEDGGRRR